MQNKSWGSLPQWGKNHLRSQSFTQYYFQLVFLHNRFLVFWSISTERQKQSFGERVFLEILQNLHENTCAKVLRPFLRNSSGRLLPLIPMFAEVTGEKLVGKHFCLLFLPRDHVFLSRLKFYGKVL